MSEPYIGEIRMFGGNFAPRDWAFCNGTMLTVPGNETLFSLLGPAYGGDGRSTFALPDMRGRIPVQFGQGAGLSSYALGAKAGVESVPLDISQIPPHAHTIQVSKTDAVATMFSGDVLAEQQMYEDFPGALKTGPLGDSTIGQTGQGSAHTNLMPYLCVSFILCMKGVYPQRS
jgi:microcystin-dependent protein